MVCADVADSSGEGPDCVPVPLGAAVQPMVAATMTAAKQSAIKPLGRLSTNPPLLTLERGNSHHSPRVAADPSSPLQACHAECIADGRRGGC